MAQYVVSRDGDKKRRFTPGKIEMALTLAIERAEETAIANIPVIVNTVIRNLPRTNIVTVEQIQQANVKSLREHSLHKSAEEYCKYMKERASSRANRTEYVKGKRCAQLQQKIYRQFLNESEINYSNSNDLTIFAIFQALREKHNESTVGTTKLIPPFQSSPPRSPPQSGSAPPTSREEEEEEETKESPAKKQKSGVYREIDVNAIETSPLSKPPSTTMAPCESSSSNNTPPSLSSERKKLQMTLPAFIFDWIRTQLESEQKREEIQKNIPSMSIHSVVLQVPSEKPPNAKRSNGVEYGLQRIMFFEHAGTIEYGMICHEFPSSNCVYLAIVEKTFLPGKEIWPFSSILLAYADFIAIHYWQPERESPILYIWPEPPSKEEDYYFIFKRSQAEKQVSGHTQASLRSVYSGLLRRNHAQLPTKFELQPPPPLPIFGLRGSMDYSFKMDPAVRSEYDDMLDHYQKAQRIANSLERKLHSSTLAFRLYPHADALSVLRHIEICDDTPSMFSSMPFDRFSLREKYNFDENCSSGFLKHLQERYSKCYMTYNGKVHCSHLLRSTW
eukprot:TRINITY_DN8733_c0_g1_i2.p1 TRINITY_DN8733_c0_g1~~TRINITY_DN8733_c0_g1_i2.p1  ORF type:complete len:560 (-),score=77.89 TRINITY_DN8733_c0_g1_i2:124-1803(-)